MKILSVIIPLYNSAQWLEKCLASVLNQDISMEQMEIICVNDGSPDNSAKIAKGIGERLEVRGESNPIIVIDQENQGPSGARNTGMKAATGKYLMFVDPDDFVEPNTFGGLVKQMEEEHLDMLRFNYQIVDENYQPVEKRAFEKAFDYTPCLMSGAEFLANRLDIACNIWRYIYRTEIITNNNIWCHTGDFYDDTPWLPVVLMKANRLNVCDTVVYDYLVRSDSLVQSNSAKNIERKTNGYILLIKLLEDQVNNISHLLSTECVQIDKTRIVAWYRNMEAHAIVSLLTMTAVYNYSKRKILINTLKQYDLFPLRIIPRIYKNHKKVSLINISPSFYMWLIHLKIVFKIIYNGYPGK